jgi:hypothetical protein
MRPNTDLVAVELLRPHVPVNRIATRLPSDTTVLADPAFVRIRSGLGGSVNHQIRRPVVAAEVWAAPTADGSSKTPWSRANDVMEGLVTVLDDENGPLFGVTLTLPHDAGDVRVHGVNRLSEPAKVEGDPSGFARFDVDFEINWTEIGS